MESQSWFLKKGILHTKQQKSTQSLFFYNRYSCAWPKKLLVSKSDLSTQSDLNVNASIITTCKATGDYNIDINDYTCSKPCPLPRLSDPLLMTHNWTNTTENAEYKDVMRYFHYFIIIYRVLCIGVFQKKKKYHWC